MQYKLETRKKDAFRKDVYEGFTAYPKHISSKYFYDERGDKLFQDIMAMPGYYLTQCEFEILEQQREAICRMFIANGSPFNLIELGAGDGKKTKILLRHLSGMGAEFKYQPVDISPSVLEQLTSSLQAELPEVSVEPKEGTYFETLEQLNDLQQQRKALLFLGSNIGNLLHPQAVSFLKSLQGLMKEDDLLFIGFDQKKHPQKILDAYNDPEGITAAFNKNVLLRINRELDGNFDPDNFLHWEVYDPESGTAKSYLVARKKHEVYIGALQLRVGFEAWETIHTEISQKYDEATIKWLAGEAALEIQAQYTDAGSNYSNYIFKKKG
jgi:dimethylhistidine N-methyltransferase